MSHTIAGQEVINYDHSGARLTQFETVAVTFHLMVFRCVFKPCTVLLNE